MHSPEISTRPCYSMRLVRPFLRVLASHPAIPAGLLDPVSALDLDERLPIDTVHELLRGALEMTKDPDLGLKAARELEVGTMGALEYVTMSASTMRDAIEIVGRYMKLVNDALTFSLTASGDRAVVSLQNSVIMPRAAEDFEVAAFYVGLQQHFAALPVRADSVHFTYPKPADVSEHERTFEQIALRFSQPFTGFTFDTAGLALALPSGDPHLHHVLRDHADRLLAELPKTESFVERVQALAVHELQGGDPSAQRIAVALHVSTRTLTRKLEQEGTTFKALLDDLRRRMALRFASTTDMQLSEIALMLGFSNAAAFHRAFKRWTGETPIEYRRARRG